MAKVVNIKMKTSGRSAVYDWDSWLDGRTWLLERGKDYTCTDASFRSQASNIGRVRHLRVSVNHHADGVVIQALPR